MKSEFERERSDAVALVMLNVISGDPRSELAHDVHGENEVAVKDEEANRECEVVIKMEELDDVNGVTMMKAECKTVYSFPCYRNICQL